jgi:hypothetical protein
MSGSPLRKPWAFCICGDECDGDNFEKDKDYIKIIAKIFHYNKNKQKLITELSKEIPLEINPDGIKNVQIKKGDFNE